MEVIRRERDWALCKFVHARDEDGQPYGNEWRRFRDLESLSPPPEPPVTDTLGNSDPAPDDMQPSEVPAMPPSQTFDQPIPNEQTPVPEGYGDPTSDPSRPERARRPPDRLAYSACALAASYAECRQVGFNLRSPLLTEAAYLVNLDGGADRLVAQAFDRCELRGETLMVSAEEHIRSSYEHLSDEMQRAIMISIDYGVVADELGAESDQALLVRELYAANAVDAACHGIQVPPLDPTLGLALPSSSVTSSPDDRLELAQIFDQEYSGCVFLSSDPMFCDELMALSKAKTSPDIFSERQMRGPEWDTPKELELAKVKRLDAKRDIAADDPSIRGMQVCDMLWTGRCKRNADGSINKYNARIGARGDLDKCKLALTSNDTTAPVVRTSSNLCFDAVACLRAQHKCDFDVPGAYLQGEQLSSEQRLYRPPKEARVYDERGVEILWLSNHPFYGQTNAGAIWNRTYNDTFTSTKPPHGCGMTRCPNDPSVYATNVADDPECSGQVNSTLYVDDARLAWDDDAPATAKARDIQKKISEKFGVEFGKDDPDETHFLGANIITDKSRRVASVRATSYIDLMVKRYADNDVSPCKRFPAHWSSLPADETLVRAFEAAMATRTPAPQELTTRYGSLFGSLLHATKFRPKISAALGMCGSCLTFPSCAMKIALDRYTHVVRM